MLAAHVAGDRYAFEELFYRHHCPLRTVGNPTPRVDTAIVVERTSTPGAAAAAE
jgi:hypothetical protein